MLKHFWCLMIFEMWWNPFCLWVHRKGRHPTDCWSKLPLQTRMHQPRMPSACRWKLYARTRQLWGTRRLLYLYDCRLEAFDFNQYLLLGFIFFVNRELCRIPIPVWSCLGYLGMIPNSLKCTQDLWRLCPLVLQHLCRDELRCVLDRQLEARRASRVVFLGAESAALLCFHHQ